MPSTLDKKKRTPGKRAGLSRDKIVKAAAELCLSQGPRAIGWRSLAKALGVFPATIRAHFKGDPDELASEVARAILDSLTPPHKLGQSPENYLRRWFQRALTLFWSKPLIGRYIILELTERPMLSPVFAERLLAALGLLSKTHTAAAALDLLVYHLAGLVFAATGVAWLQPAKTKAAIEKRVAALPETEFPTLKKAVQSLAVDVEARSKPGYLLKRSHGAATALIMELEAQL
jgi:TetR/AcrR family tetracycline transcriptional repressor